MTMTKVKEVITSIKKISQWMLTTVVFCVELEEIPIVKGFEEFVFTSEGVPSTVDSTVVAAIKTYIYI